MSWAPLFTMPPQMEHKSPRHFARGFFLLNPFLLPSRLKDCICPDATRLDSHMPRASGVARDYGCRAKNSAQALMRKVITSSGVWNAYVRATEAPRSGQ